MLHVTNKRDTLCQSLRKKDFTEELRGEDDVWSLRPVFRKSQTAKRKCHWLWFLLAPHISSLSKHHNRREEEENFSLPHSLSLLLISPEIAKNEKGNIYFSFPLSLLLVAFLLVTPLLKWAEVLGILGQKGSPDHISSFDKASRVKQVCSFSS